MATNSNWTIVFEDKIIIKNNGAEAGTAHVINDDAFWNQSKFSNIWAIQYGTSNVNNQVEYRDETPHSSWENANLGDISDFINKWDAAHLAQLQSDWDNNNEFDSEGNPESESDKIARLGARPTSYSS